jgi:hypothetical protein
MRCPKCGAENKETAKVCKKCGSELAVTPAWFPDAKWHLKTLGAIYAVLIVFYLGVSAALRTLPKPYDIRKIPIEMTPWLRHGEKFLPEDQLKAPPQEEPRK